MNESSNGNERDKVARRQFLAEIDAKYPARWYVAVDGLRVVAAFADFDELLRELEVQGRDPRNTVVVESCARAVSNTSRFSSDPDAPYAVPSRPEEPLQRTRTTVLVAVALCLARRFAARTRPASGHGQPLRGNSGACGFVAPNASRGRPNRNQLRHDGRRVA